MSTTIRQSHRWISMIFIATVVAVSIIGGVQEDPAEWVFYLPLPPLFLLMISGIYLFVLPYRRKSRADAAAG